MYKLLGREGSFTKILGLCCCDITQQHSSLSFLLGYNKHENYPFSGRVAQLSTTVASLKDDPGLLAWGSHNLLVYTLVLYGYSGLLLPCKNIICHLSLHTQMSGKQQHLLKSEFQLGRLECFPTGTWDALTYETNWTQLVLQCEIVSVLPCSDCILPQYRHHPPAILQDVQKKVDKMY